MDPDQQIKQLLFNSTEGAPADFTDAVMKEVKSLSKSPLAYRPLISAGLQKMFVILFLAVVAAILGLCLILTVSGFHVESWMHRIDLSDFHSSQAFLFILIFWMVFAGKTWFERKGLVRNVSHSKIHK